MPGSIRISRMVRGQMLVVLCHSVMLLSLLLPHSARAQENIVEVQSVFIFSFLNFVTWPDPAESRKLCVYGNQQIADTLERIRSKQETNATFTVQRPQTAENASACHIVYLDSSLAAGHINAIVAALEGKPVLTISDMERFPTQRGIIGMGEKNNKPHIVINERRARESGLKVSSRLLSIAEVVH